MLTVSKLRTRRAFPINFTLPPLHGGIPGWTPVRYAVKGVLLIVVAACCCLLALGLFDSSPRVRERGPAGHGIPAEQAGVISEAAMSTKTPLAVSIRLPGGEIRGTLVATTLVPTGRAPGRADTAIKGTSYLLIRLDSLPLRETGSVAVPKRRTVSPRSPLERLQDILSRLTSSLADEHRVDPGRPH